MNDFSWITCSKRRGIIAQDIDEAQKCLSAGAYKTCHIMSAGAVEAALGYAVARSGSKLPKRATLHNLIEQAIEQKLLSAGYGHLSHGLRDFRNFVHAEKSMSVEQSFDYDQARLFFELALSILEQLQQNLQSYLPLNIRAILSNENGERRNIITRQFSLGRGQHNDWPLPVAIISHDHAHIVFDQGHFFLEDRGSENGVFLDREKWHKLAQNSKEKLNKKDLFRLGGRSHGLVFQFEGVIK